MILTKVRKNLEWPDTAAGEAADLVGRHVTALLHGDGLNLTAVDTALIHELAQPEGLLAVAIFARIESIIAI
ncbi:MAG TPA: hypothetical protein VKA60_22230 [Blastocatellia bacterium]|nr:hypothetical protein [Blastocatellia bacterium]